MNHASDSDDEPADLAGAGADLIELAVAHEPHCRTTNVNLK